MDGRIRTDEDILVKHHIGQTLPSGCGYNMKQLLPPVVDLAVQSIAESPAYACM